MEHCLGITQLGLGFLRAPVALQLLLCLDDILELRLVVCFPLFSLLFCELLLFSSYSLICGYNLLVPGAQV